MIKGYVDDEVECKESRMGVFPSAMMSQNYSRMEVVPPVMCLQIFWKTSLMEVFPCATFFQEHSPMEVVPSVMRLTVDEQELS